MATRQAVITGTSRERASIIEQMENSTSSDARCSYWQMWQRSAWTELTHNSALHTITHDDMGLTAQHDQTRAFCVFCGHEVRR